MNRIDRERIYDLMTGSLILEALEEGEKELVTDEFERGMPCERLYDEVYEARCRIYDRLDVTEDADIELIIDNLLSIGRRLALKMYDYGALYGNGLEKQS